MEAACAPPLRIPPPIESWTTTESSSFCSSGSTVGRRWTAVVSRGELDEFFEKADSEEQAAEQAREAMIRNLWCKCTPRLLAEILDHHGLSHCYQKVYLPMRNTNRRLPTNYGYGFVILNSDNDFATVFEALHNVEVQFSDCRRKLIVNTAHGDTSAKDRKASNYWPPPEPKAAQAQEWPASENHDSEKSST